MPIYHDYHGDFQYSNTSWDQIQTSLKILLPNYQPISSDSDELSFQSDQKQKRLCAEIKEVCNSICSILNEMIQVEENQDPEMQEQSHPSPDSTVNSSLTSNPDHTKVQNTNPEIHNIQQESTPATFLTSNSDLTNLDANTRSRERGSCSPICAIGANITILASNSAEDGAVAKGNVEDANVEPILHFVEKERVNQPPPKPPDLPLHAKVLGGAEDDADLNRSGGTRNGKAITLSNRGDDANDVDNRGRGSAEVGAFVRRKWTAATVKESATAPIANGGLHARLLRRFVLLTPPPLLAAMFPWNRGGNGEEQSRDCWQWSAEEANRVEHGLEEGQRTLEFGRSPERTGWVSSTVTMPCEAASTATEIRWGRKGEVLDLGVGLTVRGGGPKALWNCGRNGVEVVPSFCGFRHDEKGGRVFFSEEAVTSERFLFREAALNWQHVKVEMVNPLQEGLGFQMLQAQSLASCLNIGLELTENYFKKLLGSVHFKQWDLVGLLFF